MQQKYSHYEMLLFRTLFFSYLFATLPPPICELISGGLLPGKRGNRHQENDIPLSCRSRPGFIHWVLLDFLLNLYLILFPIFLFRPSFSRRTISSWPLLFTPTLPTQILGPLKAQLLHCLAQTSPGLEASCWFIL